MLRVLSRFRPQYAGHASTSSASVDKKEVEKFGKLSSEWYDESGPFSALHSLNKLRVPWILNNVKSNSHVLDVGSGGGVLSIPLARSGLTVTGVDATKEAVSAARNRTKLTETRRFADRLNFEWSSIESFADRQENKNKFDAVIASEIVEHVADVPSFVTSLCDVAKPGAPIFITTINRTTLSNLAAIWLAEDILEIVPQGVHDWKKFVKPEELKAIMSKNGCHVQTVNGFMYHPIGNYWDWISSSQCNYALMAVKGL